MKSLFGVDFCQCQEPDEEVCNDLVYCQNCHELIRLSTVLEVEIYQHNEAKKRRHD